MAAFLLTIGVSCRHGSARTEPTAFDGTVSVRVANHSWLDVTIFVVEGTHRERLGTAIATSTTTFHFRIRRLAAGRDYQLLADPVGSRRTLTSEVLHAADGDVVTWTLEDDLSRSTVEIR